MAMLTRDQIYTPNNKPRTVSLIVELAMESSSPEGVQPIFTVRDEKEGYISLQKLFIDLTVDDPSEHKFAEEVFGDFIYWTVLRENKLLKKHLADWRLTAEAKRKSIAFEYIISEVKTQGKNSFQAAKFLIDEPWKGTTKAARAASNKTTKEAHNEAMENNHGFSSDIKRLRKEGLIQ
jgi:hypothetical protein